MTSVLCTVAVASCYFTVQILAGKVKVLLFPALSQQVLFLKVHKTNV